jgi:hypothetical protein
MAVILNSTQTLAAGAAGNWWTPAQAVVALDVDNATMVKLESRRGVADTVPKPVFFAAQQESVIRGPCSLLAQVVVGRDYRFVAVLGAPQVAAQD